MPRNHPIEQSCRSVLPLLLPLVCSRPSLSAACYPPFPACRSFSFHSAFYPSSRSVLCRASFSLFLPPLTVFPSLSVTITLPDLIILHGRDTLFRTKVTHNPAIAQRRAVSRPSRSIGFRSLSNVTYGSSDRSCFKIWTGSWRANCA